MRNLPVIPCPYCTHLDRCATCHSTGSVYVRTGPRYFPMTAQGYSDAVRINRNFMRAAKKLALNERKPKSKHRRKP